ncbi:MAG: Acetyltransferase Pat [Candidatus Accumulibacter adjunctus]|uniref:Acetyltransferase Pat n=1 Tax=Candidatus Accumulibacter adjunctus TaxID=1454001 RepID=A0A011N3U5_9PROT|nr:MAG: Acetyltransferase Pat [Candidatus Accumulibacter adjunctus]
MIDARHYRAEDKLRDGRRVVIRAITPEDKAAMLEAYHGLDPATLYLRFFAPRREPTAKELREWTEVDFVSTVRLVACIATDDGSERIIGGASSFRLAGVEAASAEISFTVEEDFQGQGLAGQLLWHLAHIARAQGVSCFIAEMLPANQAMLAVFERSGLPMQRRRVAGVVHVRLEL